MDLIIKEALLEIWSTFTSKGLKVVQSSIFPSIIISLVFDVPVNVAGVSVGKGVVDSLIESGLLSILYNSIDFS